MLVTAQQELVMIKLQVLQKALKNNTTLKNEVLKRGLLSEKAYKKIVDPRKMIQPE